MKQPTFNGRVLLPMDVIEAARAGDPLALERILRYYDRYINKLCTRRSCQELDLLTKAANTPFPWYN
nr:helix-turn-helix domain-containing protein [Pseudoflavonifractor phocaeensis]